VALLALDAHRRDQVPVGLDTTAWQSAMTEEELYGENWLLAYEASIKGWLASGTDHVGSDSNFAWLRDNGVHFYDEDALPTIDSVAEPYQD